MKAYLRQLTDAWPHPGTRPLLVREYLQARILQSLQDRGAFQRWAFLGGTALRLLYGMPRFSEACQPSRAATAASRRKLNLDGQPSRVVKYKYMKARAYESATSTVKLGVSRQVVIPKTIHDQLGLRPGDYLQVEVAEGRVVFTPKTLVDKRIDQRIAESTQDFAAGRSYGPFESAEAMVKSLRAHVRARRGSRKARR